jgi:NADPH-dependent ferric siderophore reductase
MTETTARPKRRTRHATIVSAERLTPDGASPAGGEPRRLEGTHSPDRGVRSLRRAPPRRSTSRRSGQRPRENWPRTRSCTVQAWDAQRSLLTLDFVVHGDAGVAGP